MEAKSADPRRNAPSSDASRNKTGLYHDALPSDAGQSHKNSDPRRNALNKDLFLTFMKIGGLTLGGGAAMVPIMEKEIVHKHEWLSKEEFLDIYAVSQATPGIFAVDMASHIGYKCGGVRSGIIAAMGVAVPSIVIILIIAMVFSQFKDNYWVESFFKGVRPAVVALLAVPIFTMAKSAHITWSNCWIPILSTLLIWKLGVSPAYIILFVGCAGFLYGYCLLKKGKKN